MKITPNFTYAELIISATGTRLGLKNTPTEQELRNITFTALQLEKIRTFLEDAPIRVTSCFRSEAVNKAVGGSKTSAHRFGLAADINAKGFTAPELAQQIVHMSDVGLIAFDQVILEFPERGAGAWVHVGFRRNSSQRNQILTARKVGGKTVYTQGLVI